MMRLSLEAIETLDAIDREGSFAAAARSLHKVQSAVSYTVKHLEEALGVEVFDRSGHRARLTPAGLAVLDEGRFLLSRARRIEWLAAQFREGWEPRLQIVVDGALPVDGVLRALKQLGDEGVPTHVEITMEFLRGVQRRFEQADADLMIVKELRREAHLEARALPEVEMLLVAAADHPVHAEAPHDVLSLQRHLELSVHDSSDETRGQDTNDVGGARVFYLSDFHTKRKALRMGLGFGWMPRDLVEDDLAEGALAVVGFTEGSARRFTPYLAHRTDRPLGRAGQRLLALLRDGW